MQLDLTTIPQTPKNALQTHKEVQEATSTLSKLNAQLDALQKEKEKVTKPLNEALKQECARFKPFEDQLSNLIATYKKLLTDYATVQEQEQKKLEQKILQDKRTSLSTKVEALANIEQAPTKAQSDTGSVTFTTLIKYRLVSTDGVPVSILTIDNGALKEYLKTNPLPKGIEKYEEKSLRNYRN